MSNDYFNPPNSIWPNGLKRDAEGYVIFYPLGTNKVDISTITWPEGDKLVFPFVYQNGKLVGFVDTKALTVSGSATTTMNYSHIEADFASISEGKLTVNAPNATVKKIKWMAKSLPDLSFINMADVEDENIETIRLAYKIIDNKLYDSNNNPYAILDTSKIETAAVAKSLNAIVKYEDGLFTSELNITITKIERDLQIQIFNSDLSSLKNGKNIFIGCKNLITFNGDLSALTVGDSMFENCYNLTSFTSDLSSLTSGSRMFYSCKLDAASVKNIIKTINTYSAKLTIGMGCKNTTEDKDLFAQEVGYADMTSLLAALQAKGWTVTAQYTGRPTTTYSLRKPSEDTLPVFVKLEETEEYVNYTSEDGSKKYRLDWFHETTGSTEGYTQYATIEEAIETLNIKPIEIN